MEGGGESDEEKDPAENWWPPQPGKPGEQPPAGYSEPLLVHLGDGGINLKRRHFHIFYNMKSTMISPHLRKGCFQRLWNVEIKLCTNMPTVPASSTKAPLDLCSALALQREQGLCRVRSATEELSAFLFQTVPVKTGSTVILLLACCVRFQSTWCLAVYVATKVIQKYRYCYLWMIANYPIV